MTTEEWKNLIRDLKRKQKYHWLRTCVYGYIYDNPSRMSTNKPIQSFFGRYSYDDILRWCTDKYNFGYFKNVLYSHEKR